MSFTENSEGSTNESNLNSLKWGIGVFLVLAFALGAFMSGIQVGRGWVTYSQTANLFDFFAPTETVMDVSTGRPSLNEFWEVWDLLDEKFAVGSTTAKATDEDRIRGAIDGMVDTMGDPYTIYLPPADAEAFNENISGNFSGVGMEVGLRDGMITVIAPLPDTPAEGAGIIAGDIIVKIDGESTEDMGIDAAVKLIRGEKGTEVVLQVFREGETEFIDIPIIRDTINIPTVKSEQIGDTYIIALYSFNAVAEAQVREALQDYLNSDAKTLVIDVRGNPGGYLHSAVAIGSYFLPAGKVVVKESGGNDSSEDTIFRSRGGQVQLFNPKNLVVLIDNGSASASEILAGALQDHGVATIIGTKSFGKGSVQELVELDDGSSLKVTVARWLTPNGISISEGGLTPDITISRTPAQRIAGEDPQKDAAVSFLAGEDVVSEDLLSTEDEAEEEASGE